MAEFPALPLFTDAFISDTIHLNATQTGAYLMLLMCAWRTKDCSLPDDDTLLARFARMDKRTWKANKEAIMSFWFRNDAGQWQQGRLLDERKYVEDKSSKNAANSKSRWLKIKETHDANALPNGCENDAPTPTPTPTPTPLKEKNVKKEKAIRSLSEFENHPLDGHYEKWFQEKCPRINRHEKRDQIVRWCRAKGKTYKDYWSALQDWAIRDQKQAPGQKSNFVLGINPNIAAMKGEL